MEQHAVIPPEGVQTGLVVTKANDDTWIYTFKKEDASFWASIYRFGVAPDECAVYIHAYDGECVWKTYGQDEVHRCWIQGLHIAEQFIRDTFARIVGEQ